MARSDLAPSGFFVFRTPLLPFEELEAWSEALRAPDADPEHLSAALKEDRERLRERLRTLVRRPEIRDALFVASPSLIDGLGAWYKDPDGKKGRRAEEALVRYWQRMASRPTPFGLFSGCSLGTIAGPSRLSLAARSDYRRHTRLDMDYLFALGEGLGGLPELMRSLSYRPNSSLYRAAGRLRYAEMRLADKVRSHHLVVVEASDYLLATLERGRRGATLAELARPLVVEDEDPEEAISPEEAEEFVGDLITSQLLISDLAPLVTGPEPIHDLIARLGEHPPGAGAAAVLNRVRDLLAELDAGGLGAEPDRYRAVARELEPLPTPVELPRLFQVDMFKPVTEAALGSEVVAEIERGIDLLGRLAGPLPEEDPLTRFRQDFIERYGESRSVPLVEALDEEVGIGFQRDRAGETSPLLAGLVFPPGVGENRIEWGPEMALRLRKVAAALAGGEHEIELTKADLKDFDPEDAAPLPDAFQVMATLAAPSAEALDRGDFRILLKGTAGPSGARLLGRFCHGDEALCRSVEEHLREEERLQPDAVFAEIVHLPEGRLGNILSRPVLRAYEIPFLGRAGADEEHQIPVTDLEVSIAGRQVVLWSRKLGRRVVPRLTSAHNFGNRSQGVYRFLCMLQSQGVRGGLSWSWGPLDRLPFLPRVRCGRLVLARARWRFGAEEVRKLAAKDDAARFRTVRGWRRERGLPRRVVLSDADNELLVDLDNVLSIASFAAVVRKRPEMVLTEWFPGEDQLCATGPEGRFVHELLIPWGRRREAAAPGLRTPVRTTAQRFFSPGSEWLYAKLYTGTATADPLLCNELTPLIRQALASGAADRWFFIRYGDPHWHLRLRFHGPPQRLLGEVLPRLREAVAPLLDRGQLWRFDLSTYDRELERYGGGAGIELAEQLFWVDSEAVLAILATLEGDEGADARWRLALGGIDQLLSDLGLEGESRLQVLGRMQEYSAGEFRVNSPFRKQLGERLRRERPQLEEMLAARSDGDHFLVPGFQIFDQRSRRLAPIVAQLRQREQQGELTSPVSDLAISYVHMFANRLLRSNNRAHELVIYDFLYRLARSQTARARSEEAATHPHHDP